MTDRKLKVLLTGDDGYDSPGTRILARMLRDYYDCTIVGTVEQQSGVGGHLSLKEGGKYGETVVEGIPAIWVDGYPCDGIEFLIGQFKEPFDFVVSGINWGMNIGGSIMSSGTYAAANRALNLKLTRHAIVMSWHIPAKYWTYRHNGKKDISKFVDYPGRQARDIIDEALKQNYWYADLLNVNFPTKFSNTVKFTRGLDDLKKFFVYPIDRNPSQKTFSYPKKEVGNKAKNDISIDSEALLAGYISITPHRANMFDEMIYRKLKEKRIVIGQSG